MKKITLLLVCIMLLVVSVAAFSGCAEKYTVTFTLNGGTTTDDTTLTTNKLAYKKLPTVTKEGFNFVGWCSDSTLKTLLTEEQFPIAITASTTYYAKWEAIAGWYQVILDVNDGNKVTLVGDNLAYSLKSDTDSSSKTYQYIYTNQPIDISTLSCTKTGNNLVGWYTTEAFTEGTKVEGTYMLTKDCVFYAKWETSKVTLTFNANGGSEVASIEQDYNTTFTKPSNPTKEDNVFLGWYSNEELTSAFDFSTAIKEDTTVYAKWQTESQGLAMELSADGTYYIVIGLGENTADAIVIPSAHEGKPVTEIAEKAFYGATSLKEVVVPTSITKIGKNAFGNCTSLRQITIPFVGETKTATGEKALFGFIFSSTENHGTETISYWGNGGAEFATNYIPATLTEVIVTDDDNIGQGAFQNCVTLNSVSLNEGIATIGKNAFAHASLLTTTNIPYSVTTIGERAYYSCVKLNALTIPNQKVDEDENEIAFITSIDKEAFYNCVALETLNLPNGITVLGDRAFANCYKIKEFDFIGVQTIGAGAFLNCNLLSEFDLSAVTSIGDRAFSGCNLTTVTLPATVATLGKGAFEYNPLTNFKFSDDLTFTVLPDSLFSNCTKLATITYGNNAFTAIGEKTFYKCSALVGSPIQDSVSSIGKSAFEGCTGITTVTLPNRVTEIADSTFAGCSALSSFSTGTAVITKIGEKAFYGCEEITNFTLPDTVTVIGKQAFADCEKLLRFDINESSVLQEIGESAFEGCIKLSYIKFIPDTVTAVGDGAFDGCTRLRLFLEADSKHASLTDWYEDWEEFADVTETARVYYSMNSNKVIESDRLIYAITTGDKSYATLLSYVGDGTSVTVPLGVTVSGSSSTVYEVKTIGAYAFADTKVVNVVLGSKVTKIENRAFSGCSSLTSLYVPASVTEFGLNVLTGCTKLTKLFVGAEEDAESLTKWNSGYKTDGVSRKIFYSVVLSGRTDGQNLLVKDGELEYIVSNDDIQLVNYFGSSSRLTIPSNVTVDAQDLTVKTIGANAFYGNTNLQVLIIKEGVTTITADAFANCKTIVTVALPLTLTTIEESALDICTNMYVMIVAAEKDAESLTNWASGWNKVSGIDRVIHYSTLSDEVITLSNVVYVKSGDNAIAVATTGSNIVVGETVTINSEELTVNEIGARAFYRTSAASISLPATVTKLGEYCFAYSTSLVTITLSQADISAHAFDSCTGLVTAIIPDGVTTIGESAFAHCTKLKAIVLPTSITAVAKNALLDTSVFDTVYFKGTKEQFTALTALEGVVDEGNEKLTATTTKVAYYVENVTDVVAIDNGFDGGYWRYKEGKPAVWTADDRPADLEE